MEYSVRTCCTVWKRRSRTSNYILYSVTSGPMSEFVGCRLTTREVTRPTNCVQWTVRLALFGCLCLGLPLPRHDQGLCSCFTPSQCRTIIMRPIDSSLHCFTDVASTVADFVMRPSIRSLVSSVCRSLHFCLPCPASIPQYNTNSPTDVRHLIRSRNLSI